VNGLVEAGIVEARAGAARLLPRAELPEGWDPAAESGAFGPRVTVWEAVQHLVKRHETGGTAVARDLLACLPADKAEAAREPAYRLYQVCERRKWAQEALAYNALVVDWPEIQRAAERAGAARMDPEPAQARLAV
jgi:putative DNA methylase